MSFTSLNFAKLTALNPTVYSEQENSFGQKVRFVEHPTRGDEYPVIVLFLDLKLAINSEFYELGEIDEIGGEYEIVYAHGEAKCLWEIGA